MKLSPALLTAQYGSAVKAWPFISYVERVNGLPPYLLFAVGSRETNLRNVIGDGGHGVGIFQRDDRAFAKQFRTMAKAYYIDHPRLQADQAAELLLANYRSLKDWGHAVAAYNAGAGRVRLYRSLGLDPDRATTGRDYSSDVMSRRDFLVLLNGGH